jgi:gamma-glutamylcyclotransferase (GGCT)/AIG2-like uncharacterized protein YtfP
MKRSNDTMKENIKIYGAYGSNMNVRQMSKRCPRAKVIGKGNLKNYRLTFRGFNKGVANVEIMKGRVVPIVLWEITPECEIALDIYEGFPRLYVKREVEVVTETGLVKAMVYVMAKRYEESPAEPSRYYLETIKQGYLDNNISLKALKDAVVENDREIAEIDVEEIDK